MAHYLSFTLSGNQIKAATGLVAADSYFGIPSLQLYTSSRRHRCATKQHSNFPPITKIERSCLAERIPHKRRCMDHFTCSFKWLEFVGNKKTIHLKFQNDCLRQALVDVEVRLKPSKLLFFLILQRLMFLKTKALYSNDVFLL